MFSIRCRYTLKQNISWLRYKAMYRKCTYSSVKTRLQACNVRQEFEHHQFSKVHIGSFRGPAAQSHTAIPTSFPSFDPRQRLFFQSTFAQQSCRYKSTEIKNISQESLSQASPNIPSVIEESLQSPVIEQTVLQNIETSAPLLEASVGAATVAAASRRMLLFPDFPFIQAAEASVYYAHLFTGLPWWGAIVAVAGLLRGVVVLPLTVYQQHNAARLEAQAPEIKALSRRLQEECLEGRRREFWTEEKMKLTFNRKIKEAVRKIRIRDNCHPLKNTAAMYLQIPIWISLSYGLRNIALRGYNPTLDHHSAYASLSEGGTLWFPDLTATDPTWILPILMGAVTLANIEMHYLTAPEVTKYRRYLTYFLRGVALIMVPVCASVPTCMGLYWVTSGACAAANNLLLQHSGFRRLVGLPFCKTESSAPLRTLAALARQRYFPKAKQKS